MRNPFRRRRPDHSPLAPDGPVGLWDRSDPGARRVEIRLPDGVCLELTEELGGWACGFRDGRAAHVRPTVREVVGMAVGPRRREESWVAVLEEIAIPLGTAGAAPLTPDDEYRVARLRERAPRLYLDGPRARNGGGWYVFVGGLPARGREDDAWVTAEGATPEEAARAALRAAERRVSGLHGPGE
jgi:hypothetical protein